MKKKNYQCFVLITLFFLITITYTPDAKINVINQESIVSIEILGYFDMTWIAGTSQLTGNTYGFVDIAFRIINEAEYDINISLIEIYAEYYHLNWTYIIINPNRPLEPLESYDFLLDGILPYSNIFCTIKLDNNSIINITTGFRNVSQIESWPISQINNPNNETDQEILVPEVLFGIIIIVEIIFLLLLVRIIKRKKTNLRKIEKIS